MAGIEARAFWVTAPGRGEIRSETLDPPRDGELLIRTRFSAISRGTEKLVFNGGVPKSEYRRMRAPFQAGEFPAPVKYGYSNVGVVEEGSADWLGRDVFCLYPHQTRYVVAAESVHRLPDAVPPARAVLAANLETALNALWDADPEEGSHVTVIGAGAVGLLVAWLAARQTAVELIDIDPTKASAASALGLRFASPETATPGAGTLFHTSGSPGGLRTALRLAGFEATIIEMSWYGTTEVALPLGEAFHSQRLSIRSSQVGAVARSRRARVSPRGRMTEALALLDHAALDALITDESPFEEMPAVMAAQSAERSTICHRIAYG